MKARANSIAGTMRDIRPRAVSPRRLFKRTPVSFFFFLPRAGSLDRTRGRVDAFTFLAFDRAELFPGSSSVEKFATIAFGVTVNMNQK